MPRCPAAQHLLYSRVSCAVAGRMSSVLELAWRRYNSQLTRRPLRTKAVTSGIIAGVSDLVAQKILGHQHVQLRRTALMAIFGALWSGPSAHFWQKFMERCFGSGKNLATALKKVCPPVRLGKNICSAMRENMLIHQIF